MRHLFESWKEFSAAAGMASHILFLADYDGTLTPIVERPEDAVLSHGIKNKLSILAKKPGFSIGVISGRSLEEVRAVVDIKGIYYSGNHGLEIEGPELKYLHPQAEQARAVMKDLAGKLNRALKNIAGVIVQEKGFSLSVHYRMAKKEEEPAVRNIFHEIAMPMVGTGDIEIFSGKKVLEVKPPLDWDKGKAVKYIANEIKTFLKLDNILVIFLGDDVTDESAFKVLRQPDCWGVFIGDGDAPSAAAYYLRNVFEVEELLGRLIELR